MLFTALMCLILTVIFAVSGHPFVAGFCFCFALVAVARTFSQSTPAADQTRTTAPAATRATPTAAPPPPPTAPAAPPAAPPPPPRPRRAGPPPPPVTPGSSWVGDLDELRG